MIPDHTANATQDPTGIEITPAVKYAMSAAIMPPIQQITAMRQARPAMMVRSTKISLPMLLPLYRVSALASSRSAQNLGR